MNEVTNDITAMQKEQFAGALGSVLDGLKTLDSYVYLLDGPQRDELREAVVELRTLNGGVEIQVTTPFGLMEIVEVATRLQERLKG